MQVKVHCKEVTSYRTMLFTVLRGGGKLFLESSSVLG